MRTRITLFAGGAVGVLALVLIATAGAGFRCQEPPRADSAHAEPDLLAQARLAAGGVAAFSKVSTIAASGRMLRHVRVVTGGGSTGGTEAITLKGRVRIRMRFPDQFRIDSSGTDIAGNSWSLLRVVNGTDAWRIPPSRATGSGRKGTRVDVSDFREALRNESLDIRRLFAVLAVGWLFHENPAYRLTWTAIQGGGRPDEGVRRVAGTGPDGFEIALQLDPGSYLPAAISTSVWASEAQGSLETEIPESIRLADHRREGEILLPHRVQFLESGRVVEEWILSSFEINRPIDSKVFSRAGK